MGREIKRVPEGFDWPLNKVWDGFLNPHYRKCPDCDNGYTAARDRLSDLVGLIMLSGGDSLDGKNHPYFHNMPGLYHAVIPGPDMAELTGGLAGRKPSGFLGHDACDGWSAIKKIIIAAGLDPATWGICQNCKGDAIDPAIKDQYEAWKETPVPEGVWYQLWETTSEGSPISPAFATPEELARWLADNNASSFGDMTATYEQWLAFIVGPGWAPSAVMKDGVLESGVTSAS